MLCQIMDNDHALISFIISTKCNPYATLPLIPQSHTPIRNVIAYLNAKVL